MNQEQTGGLRLPDAVGPGEQDLGAISRIWDTFDEMELEVTKMGFPPVPKPAYQCPELTADMLTTASAADYTSTYQRMESWHNYAHNTLARIKALQLGIANEMNKLGRLVRDGAPKDDKGKKLPAGTLTDMVENHPRYEELKLLDQEWEQKKIMLQSHVVRLEKDLKLMSRQVEIRRQDTEAGTQGSRTYGNRR